LSGARARVQRIGRAYVILNAGEIPPAGRKKHIAALRRIYISRALKSKENFRAGAGENSSYDL
jgi:hypothetical protein